MTQGIKLVIFDMAGTTVQDLNEVEKCFFEAIESTGLQASREEVNAMMGWSKIKVFETLWNQQIGGQHPDFEQRVSQSYTRFTQLLEHHYRHTEVKPIQGIESVFHQLRKQGIKVALTTGFYREVTDIILNRLGWDRGLDQHYVAPDEANSMVDCSVSSSDIPEGRPAPDMIFRVMEKTGIQDPRAVVNIGDTPSDILSGRNAGVALTIGVTYGTHTAEELNTYKPDALIDSPTELFNLIAI